MFKYYLGVLVLSFQIICLNVYESENQDSHVYVSLSSNFLLSYPLTSVFKSLKIYMQPLPSHKSLYFWQTACIRRGDSGQTFFTKGTWILRHVSHLTSQTNKWYVALRLSVHYFFHLAIYNEQKAVHGWDCRLLLLR